MFLKVIEKVAKEIDKIMLNEMGKQLVVQKVSFVMSIKAAWPLKIRIAEKGRLTRINKDTLLDFTNTIGHNLENGLLKVALNRL
jgi:hypothetical protein